MPMTDYKNNQEKLIYAAPFLLRRFNDPSEDIQIFRQLHDKLEFVPFLIDRSKTIKFPFNCEINQDLEIPKYEKSDHSFFKASIESANQISKENKKIYILWSGGIDSTNMLSSFLASDIDKKMITVVCNHDSINEYPWFWKTYIKNNLKYISTEKFFQFGRWNLVDGIIVEANPVDSLFGGVLSNPLIKKGHLKKLYYPATEENIIHVFQDLGFSNIESTYLNKIINLTIDKSPRKIENIYDIFWWFGYNFLWAGICLKGDLRFYPNTNYRSFYNEKPIQIWAFDNIETMTNLYSYKKDYLLPNIFNFTQDKIYFENKKKYPSNTRLFLTAMACMKTTQKMIYNFSESNLYSFYESNNIFTKE